MKRHPSTMLPATERRPADRVPPSPQDDGERIESFLVSGGQTFFLVSTAFDPRFQGVQLVASHYVPSGRVGWLKQIRVAPYAPPHFTGPYGGWLTAIEAFEPVGNAVEIARASGQAGVWQTPMGWESYFDLGTTDLPQWHWELRVLPGTLSAARLAARAGAFSFTDPSSWYLLPDIAVPASVYPSGLPGSSLEQLGAQRMQVLQKDELSLHSLIPQNSTVCLFARWSQSEVVVRATNDGSTLVESPPAWNQAGLPLLPSFGQMLGYTQAANHEPAHENGRHGWGG